MRKIKHTTIASILVIVFGIGLFALGTDGFRAYTAEAARVLELNKTNPLFSNATLEDSTGTTYSISEFEGKYVLITFIYASCGTFCPQLEMNMAEIYDKLPSSYVGEEIIFLSITFDTVRDTVDVLKKYRGYFDKEESSWRMARIPDQKELDTLLEAFGVIVIPDDSGNFTHNGAFYFVDREGRLIEVMNYAEIDQAVGKITTRIERDKGA
ncbi:MAG: SCO family protein [Candidatus Cohnella colombiensis]|uniref:SCO family protein n=1 Tax=Candidatus Cohnella colombiensis TaxID=3121368 RepID=A0AA95EWE2_9BACL|nr:MAG: SCO family protein [Cohnella sp.]